MIEVDFFWAYAIGATFAFASCKQLKNQTTKWYDSKYFTFTLFYLACFFAPSGIYLLWNHLSWETMQVFNISTALPAWLVLIFVVTNVTDGILAYYICYRFIKKDNYYGAALQVILGYFIMFFILAHGWDGWGFDRFFYDRAMYNNPNHAVNGGTAWRPGSGDVLVFITSSVAITLYTMGVIILPPMFYFFVKWIREGLSADESIPKEKIPSPMKLMILMLVTALGISLGYAVGATLVCKLITAITGHQHLPGGWDVSFIGMLIGLPLFCIPMYFFTMRKGTIGYKFFKMIVVEDPKVAPKEEKPKKPVLKDATP